MKVLRLVMAFNSLLVHQIGRSETVYRISGTVVSARDGSPIPHCRMRANPADGANGGERTQAREANGPPEGTPRGFSDSGRGAPQGRAFTRDDAVDADERGHFNIMVAHAGAWRLTAAARGFRTQAYDEHEGFSSAVVLTSAAPSVALKFRLTPDSEITGVVLDEASESVRGAQLTLQRMSATGSDTNTYTNAGNSVTDDRGRYELEGLAPGQYRLRVQARPWYATNLVGTSAALGATSAPNPDSSLDVVYAPVWFPGTADSSRASAIVLKGGEEKEADFNLVPIPSVHLRITLPQTEIRAGFQRGVNEIQISPVSADGLPTMGPGIAGSRQDGNVVEYSGLLPGLYQIQHPGQPSSKPSLIEVTAISPHTLSLADSIPTIPLTLTLDGLPGQERRRLYLEDSTSGRRFFATAGGLRGRRTGDDDDPDETSLDLPPGRYIIRLLNGGTAYLTSFEASGATLTGKTIDVETGTPHLTLHFTSGTATVSGMARSAGHAAAGAMVLLVPATMGQPENMVPVLRDQTNTDGSFLLRRVIPGRYILLALDNGWEVNWRDTSTLARYLPQGVPVEIAGEGSVRRDIEAQRP